MFEQLMSFSSQVMLLVILFSEHRIDGGDRFRIFKKVKST